MKNIMPNKLYLEDNGEESLKVLDRYGVIRVAF